MASQLIWQRWEKRALYVTDELQKAKNVEAKDRARRTNERSQLLKVLGGRQSEWRTKRLGFQSSQAPSLAVYREICKTVFVEAGIFVPAFAQNQQAHLCRHIHWMTAEDNQLTYLKRDCLDLAHSLEKTVRILREECTEIEIRYLNRIFLIEREIRELQSKLSEYPLIDASRYGCDKRECDRAAPACVHSGVTLETLSLHGSSCSSLRTDMSSSDEDSD
ncbi:predicted protein [Phaeodactylum tricornutum CCAP 1055/1]|uniref:Uncharacterized protein n=1 Tax=Phaeodactylum tricornutum (strain CCAP 1055/1) TaxID=556484 RepID=B7GB58_PHATC|nr:predicted protein [Phaeodactylum tricornutum CCAP 1055/1]EEC44155.1 predicted protein [Phaeodactylum tricornutum CCAP 1055/1]|eukprot:XP_002184406.1 predicted protein [Phaeodactylum tricornutum CCAP 1055/1]